MSTVAPEIGTPELDIWTITLVFWSDSSILESIVIDASICGIKGLTVIVLDAAPSLYPLLITLVEMVILDGVVACGAKYVDMKLPFWSVYPEFKLRVPPDTEMVTNASGIGTPELST
jgi:hypothetical protein